MADKEVRKRTTKKVAKKTTARKAPTRSSVSTEERRNLAPFVALSFFVAVLIGSVFVGYSDGGQIDVTSTFNERVANATPEEQEILQNIPVQQRRPSAPNGGLVPTRDPNLGTQTPAPQPVVEAVASSTATTTDDAASSTESVEEESTEESILEEESVESTSESSDTEETTPVE